MNKKSFYLAHRKLLLLLILMLLTISLYFFPIEKISPFVTTSSTGKFISSKITTPLLSSQFPFSPHSPTIESIFSNDHTWIATLSAEKVRTIIVTGDVIPARSVNYQAVSRNNFTWAFEKVADLINKADITFINLETPLLENCSITQEGMVFCGSSQHVKGLVLSGVDIVSLANNHAANHQEVGVLETSNLLSKNNIKVTGIKGPAHIPIRGITFAFLGYNDISAPQPGISNTDEETIKREIQDAKKQADVVIVTFHWGVEYRAQPDNRQKYLGRLAIDAGSDLVIGNHPHWIQPIEFYKGKLITYAHGNFVFDQMWSDKTKEGVVGKYTFYDNQLIDIEYVPLKIKDYGQSYFVDGSEKQRILDEMKIESLTLSNKKLN